MWLASTAGRLTFSYPLEWMEGATLEHARRLLHGEPLYAAPTAEFIAYLYPPVGYLPMALGAWLCGPSLPVARASCVAVFALGSWGVARAATQHARDPRAGLLALGLWTAGYGYGGGFADLARIDATLLCLLAWGTERLCAGRLASGLYLFALSVFAKQHGLLLLGASSLWAVATHGRQAFTPAFAAWLGVIATGGILELLSDGWFLAYTWKLPRSHGLEPILLLGYLPVYVGLFLPVLGIAAAAEAWRMRRAPPPAHPLLLAALGVSALGRAHPGGDDNVLLPGYLLLCVVAAGPLWRGLVLGARARRLALAGAVLAQLAWLWQPPWRHWPSLDTRRGFAALEQALRQCGGEAGAALDFSALAPRPLAHTMALSDLRLAGATAMARHGTGALLTHLRSRAAPHALAVGASFPELEAVVAERYELCRALDRFALPTGYQPAAQRVYRRAQLAVRGERMGEPARAAQIESPK